MSIHRFKATASCQDLRIVTTALKVVTDMEQSVIMLQILLSLLSEKKRTNLQSGKAHSRNGNVAKSMIRDAVNAFINLDMEQAKEIIKRDDLVDELFDKTKQEVAVILRTSNEHVDQCVDILMIAKYFERIGDHAENICEWTQFHETGSVNNIRIL